MSLLNNGVSFERGAALATPLTIAAIFTAVALRCQKWLFEVLKKF